MLTLVSLVRSGGDWLVWWGQFDSSNVNVNKEIIKKHMLFSMVCKHEDKDTYD